MREPSIHITERRLSIILTEVLPFGTNVLGVTREIMKKARPYAITNRSVISTTERIEKKAKKITSSTTEDANLMARLLVAVRRQLKHKGVQQITPASRDWDTIKVMTQQANNFCADFEIHIKRVGYIAYLKSGIAKMQQFSIRKFNSLYQPICEYYQATLEIEADDNPEFTKKIHDYYKKKVAVRTGIMVSFKDRPEKYKVFVGVRKLCKELTVDPAIFIDAQFDGLEKFSAVPDPIQLLGQKAKERLQRYMLENNLTILKNGNGRNKSN